MISTISKNNSLKTVLEELKKTGLGMTCITNHKEKVVGVISDGDVREALLNGKNLESLASSIMNENFKFINKKETRENILKLFDQNIRILPILDEDHKLVDLINSPGPLLPRKHSFARARAPGRISLSGGGTDFTKYFVDNDGCGLSVSIAKYAHGSMLLRKDEKVNIYSSDFKKTYTFKSFKEINKSKNHDLITAGIKILNPQIGFDLELGTDFPPGSGLGGSASLLACIAGLFKELCNYNYSKKDIAEFAFQAERIELKIPGGWQDQYSTVFGGFNYLEFSNKANEVSPLRLEKWQINEIEENLILCYTGDQHLGNKIQNSNASSNFGSLKSSEIVFEIKENTKEMKKVIVEHNMPKFGNLLSRTWELKKLANPLTTNVKIDAIYEVAMINGSLGGRLLCTGSGGFFIFLAKNLKKFK